MLLSGMSGLFAGTSLERPVTCERCGEVLAECGCPRGAGGEVVLPSDQAVRVWREKRRGKFVTVIRDLDEAASDVPGMLKALRKKLATGGSVVAGKKGAEIQLQGDHREVVVEYLKGLGYPAKGAGG